MLDGIELHLGDCLELMKDIPDGSVDLVLCDLPYGTTSISWDSIIDFKELWKIYSRIAKKNCTYILFGNSIFTSKLVNSNEKEYKYNLVWEKSKCGSPLLSKYRPMMKHEDIVIFTKGGGKHKTYNPQMVKGEPYSRKKTPIKLNNHGYGLTSVTTKNEGVRYPSSVLKFPQSWRRQDQIHPTQKPVASMEYLVKTYSNEGDLVLDNCMGSGTTGVACVHTGRRFIGMEKEEKYFNIAEKRIKEAVFIEEEISKQQGLF